MYGIGVGYVKKSEHFFCCGEVEDSESRRKPGGGATRLHFSTAAPALSLIMLVLRFHLNRPLVTSAGRLQGWTYIHFLDLAASARGPALRLVRPCDVM